MLIGTGIGIKNYQFVLEELNPYNDNVDSERYDRLVKIGVLTINEVCDKLKKPRYDPKKFPGADEPFLFTSSGPILLSKLLEYMDAALMPKQPEGSKPPGLPGSSGSSKSSTTRTGKKINKMEIEDIIKMLEEAMEYAPDPEESAS